MRRALLQGRLLLSGQEDDLEKLEGLLGKRVHVGNPIPGPSHERLCDGRSIVTRNGQAGQATVGEGERQFSATSAILAHHTHGGRLRARDVGPAMPASPMQYVEWSRSLTPNASLEATCSVGPLSVME